ncbi:polysaccharide pyruvyl transferase family protein [Tichowtungia aerotolerans]|uniref:Polysaccharide pyruvyl transferase domain-containing protein n=1 Tax=Tichowtungia aerotolerans TaxID=2697043 RepID=A0A6P1M908_9BACT|nr:polysaccharide pyruvyl transferase family protein [Tichowtungia aerotolerans]QHI68066.1 hypothetical protein GT409_00890 [Tichowtungia aerotolerans]
MNVCIIGWYGSETIGDRAILAGILALLAEQSDELTVQLGSLFPFFSERTIREDSPLWNDLTESEINVELFDSTNSGELGRAIQQADLLLLGGGPLMDLREIHMLSYAFRTARSKGVRCGVLGCGVGPLKKKSCVRAVKEILKVADFAVFRDALCLSALEQVGIRKEARFQSAIDPAAHCAELYRRKGSFGESLPRITVNLRALSTDYIGSEGIAQFNQFAEQLVQRISELGVDHDVLLVPHHYFYVGGDDRVFLNRLRFNSGCENIRVQNVPMSLAQTMNLFATSRACVGMRFHAILLMTVFCNHCRIVNYTGKQFGKIQGYLQTVDPTGFFKRGRMVSLPDENLSTSFVDDLLGDEPFELNPSCFSEAVDVYRKALQ